MTSPPHSTGRPGTFDSRNPGQPIALDRLRGRSAEEVAQLLGRPVLDRTDGLARTQRYESDACSLFVHLYQDGGGWRVKRLLTLTYQKRKTFHQSGTRARPPG